jgi:hypothetical protein
MKGQSIKKIQLDPFSNELVIVDQKSYRTNAAAVSGLSSQLQGKLRDYLRNTPSRRKELSYSKLQAEVDD